MRQLRRGGSIRVLAGLAMLGLGGMAGLTMASGTGSAPNGEPTSATVPPVHFASEWDVVAATPLPAWFDAIRSSDVHQLALLNLNPSDPEAAVPAALPEAEPAEPAAGPVLASASATPEIPKPTARPKKANAAPTHNVLNDAQIASIKQRLRLTRDQEAYWPAVEAALREIAWNKAQRARRQTVAQSAQAIDVNSPPVQKLKSAAFPLLMSFSDEQKQEVRELVQVIGLGKLAQQF